MYNDYSGLGTYSFTERGFVIVLVDRNVLKAYVIEKQLWIFLEMCLSF